VPTIAAPNTKPPYPGLDLSAARFPSKAAIWDPTSQNSGNEFTRPSPGVGQQIIQLAAGGDTSRSYPLEAGGTGLEQNRSQVLALPSHIAASLAEKPLPQISQTISLSEALQVQLPSPPSRHAQIQHPGAAVSITVASRDTMDPTSYVSDVSRNLDDVAKTLRR
jgi:hypothetical protein